MAVDTISSSRRAPVATTTASSVLKLWLTVAVLVLVDCQPGISTEMFFPTDANLVNVHAFGALGDGRHDDTAALRRAVAESLHPVQKGPRNNVILLIPEGTYLVSDTIDFGESRGETKRIIVHGAGRERSTIKLADRAAGFQSSKAPKPVLSTFSGNLSVEAFLVQLDDLTIDVGSGNSGAIGLHFMANNVGGLRDVAIVSSDAAGAGTIGLDLTQAFEGPTFFDRVVIRGFDTGISTKFDEYGVVFRDLVLDHQRHVGFDNARDSVTIDGLESRGAMPVIVNREQGLVALARGRLNGEGALGTPALVVEAGATLHVVNTSLDGYIVAGEHADRMEIGSDVPKSFIVTGGTLRTERAAFDLPSPRPVRLPDYSSDEWVRVNDFTSDGIERALQQGKPVIYLPVGTYRIDKPMTVPPSVRRIVGFASRLQLSRNYAIDQPVFTVDPRRRESLWIEEVDGSHNSMQAVWFLNRSRPDFVLRDSMFWGIGYRGEAPKDLTDRPQPYVYLLNVSNGGRMEFLGQNVFAWQLDPEGMGPKVIGEGSRLTIYGLKTEGPGSVLSVTDGELALFGGEIFTNSDIPPGQPAYEIKGAKLCVTTMEVSNHPSGRGLTQYTTLMRWSTGPDDAYMTADYPQRGSGRTYAGVCAP
jgi:hypothetical protein